MDLNPSDRWYIPRMSRHIMPRHIPTLPTGISDSWDSRITAFSTPPRKTGTGLASMSKLRRLQQVSRVRLQNIIQLKNRLGKEYWEQKYLFCNSKSNVEPGCRQFMMHDIMKEISRIGIRIGLSTTLRQGILEYRLRTSCLSGWQICLRGISKSIVQYYM